MNVPPGHPNRKKKEKNPDNHNDGPEWRHTFRRSPLPPPYRPSSRSRPPSITTGATPSLPHRLVVGHI